MYKNKKRTWKVKGRKKEKEKKVLREIIMVELEKVQKKSGAFTLKLGYYEMVLDFILLREESSNVYHFDPNSKYLFDLNISFHWIKILIYSFNNFTAKSNIL